MDLRRKKLFLLDMDGTLYIDEQLFDGAAEFLEYVREKGGRYLFLTNNSSRGVEAYVEKLGRLGIHSTPEDFLTSVDALIADIFRRGKEQEIFYAFGTASFRAQLQRAGLQVTEDRERAQTLLCGFDTELTFRKVEDACILLNRGVDFIATNPDWVCPTWYGFVPDCGSVCEMLHRATGRSPRFIGKPQPEMVLLAMERTGYSREETVAIGDRIYTDIACGRNAGVDAALVLSGESSMDTVAQSEVKPTAIYQDIREILEKMREGQ